MNGHIPIVQYLIEKGANIEAKDEDQNTYLHWACQNDHFQVVHYLIVKVSKDFIEVRDKIENESKLLKILRISLCEYALL